MKTSPATKTVSVALSLLTLGGLAAGAATVTPSTLRQRTPSTISRQVVTTSPATSVHRISQIAVVSRIHVCDRASTHHVGHPVVQQLPAHHQHPRGAQATHEFVRTEEHDAV